MAEQQVKEKAEPDDAFLESPGAFIAKASQKVQLDVDDAPFLVLEEEKIETPPTPAVQESEKEEKPVKEKKPLTKKKLIIIIGISGFLVIAIAIAVYFFFFAPAADIIETEIIVVPNFVDEMPQLPKDKIISFEPFWVEVMDSSGKKRFLTAKFSLVANSPNLDKEIVDKKIIVRDAIYYYLTNKSFEFLTDYNNGEKIKEDIKNLIDTYLITAKLDNILYENYLVK